MSIPNYIFLTYLITININGRKIKEFDIDSYQIGQKNIIWNAHSNSSGVYFAVFEQLGNSNIRKLSLIK